MLLIQLTGLSGAGKSSIAQLTRQLLQEAGLPVIIVDGDECRKTICKDLGFSKEDRNENIRRLGMLADKFVKAGNITLIAAINPYELIRKELAQQYRALTVWVHCSREELIARDTKGLYKRALLPDDHPDKVKNLTGINDTFDEPELPALVIHTHTESAAESAQRLFQFIIQQVKR
jgi:adenylyl-sulfate kinase